MAMTPTSEEKPGPNTFLGIPRELRDQIYELTELLTAEHELEACETVSSSTWDEGCPESPLSNVCRQIKSEALGLVYSRNHFAMWLGMPKRIVSRPSGPSSSASSFGEAELHPSYLPPLREIKYLCLRFFVGSGPGLSLARQLMESTTRLEKLTIQPSAKDTCPSSKDYISALQRFMAEMEKMASLRTVRLADPISTEVARSIAAKVTFRVESVCQGRVHADCDEEFPWSPDTYAGHSNHGEAPSTHCVSFENIAGLLWNVTKPVKRWHMKQVFEGSRP